MLTLWERNGINNKIKCPLDRRAVSMLIPCLRLRRIINARTSFSSFQEEEEEKVNFSQSSRLSDERYDTNIQLYNSTFTEIPRPLGEQIHEDWILLRRIFRGETSPATIFRIILSTIFVLMIIYVLFPFDLIPDSFGLVGYSDDLMIVFCILWAAFVLVEAYRRRLVEQISQNTRHN